MPPNASLRTCLRSVAGLVGGVLEWPGYVNHGRYPSDLTDAQWALVDPLLSATRGGGRPETHPRREVVTRSCTCCVRAARGASCRRTFRRGRRSTGTSRAGARTGRWTACTTRCAGGCAAPRAGRKQPSAAIIDAQSVKGAATVGAHKPRLRRGQVSGEAGGCRGGGHERGDREHHGEEKRARHLT